MKDLRISFGLLDHPKKIKLQRRCGKESFENLLRLWMFVAQNKPRGVLGSMDSEDIEIASMWDGDAGVFTESLIEVGFLDFKNNAYAVKDWKEHNGYAFHSPERSAKARMAAEKRWSSKSSEDSISAKIDDHDKESLLRR